MEYLPGRIAPESPKMLTTSGQEALDVTFSENDNLPDPEENHSTARRPERELNSVHCPTPERNGSRGVK